MECLIDMRSLLLFRFRSGTHGLNEELGRHVLIKEVKLMLFCEYEYESNIEHVL